MNIEAQDNTARRLIDALAKHKGPFQGETHAALMRVTSGHERRTVGLLSMAEALVTGENEARRQEAEPFKPSSFWRRWWNSGREASK